MLAGYDVSPRQDYFWEAWEADVRVPDKILSCVVFIGRDDSGPFTAYGTGFLAVKSTGGRLFQHIVTARHVIENINSDCICIRINRKGDRVEHTYSELA